MWFLSPFLKKKSGHRTGPIQSFLELLATLEMSLASGQVTLLGGTLLLQPWWGAPWSLETSPKLHYPICKMGSLWIAVKLQRQTHPRAWGHLLRRAVAPPPGSVSPPLLLPPSYWHKSRMGWSRLLSLLPLVPLPCAVFPAILKWVRANNRSQQKQNGSLPKGWTDWPAWQDAQCC